MILYHGTSEPNFIPQFGKGRDYHDYGNGLYTTENIDSAKEWACQGENETAFVYCYELETLDLSILNLDENNVLAWVSILMSHRKGSKIRGGILERCNEMIDRYGVDVSGYDIIRGFRANDSYFQFTTDFLTGAITLDTLAKSIIAGKLGLQVCIKSERAYTYLKHIETIKITSADYAKYHNSYWQNDRTARDIANGYANEPQLGKFLHDILKEGI